MGAHRAAPIVASALALIFVALVATTSGGMAWPSVGHGAHHAGTSHRSTSSGGSTSGGSGSPPSPTGSPTTTSRWLPDLGRFVLIAVLAFVTLAVLASLRVTLVRRQKIPPERSATIQAPLVEEPEAPESLQTLLSEQLASLDVGTPRNAIVAAWVQLEDFAASHGFAKDRADTPAEFIARCVSAYDLDSAAIERLAELYREARFSRHPLGEHHRVEARECLTRLIRADVRS